MNDQIYIECLVKISHGPCKGEIGTVIDFDVEEDFVDVLVDTETNFVRFLSFEDVEFIN